MISSIIFMRHGRSQADDEGVYEGRYDSPLTSIGKAQAYARARQWHAQQLHLDLIITSPLARAYATAEIVAHVLQVRLETDVDWMERDIGPLAGLTPDHAALQYPKPAFRTPYEPACGTGESEWELHCRATHAVERLIRRGPGRFLVVAHGNILNAALRTIVGTLPPVNDQGIWFAFGDTGYACTTYDTTRHRWVLQELHAETDTGSLDSLG